MINPAELTLEPFYKIHDARLYDVLVGTIKFWLQELYRFINENWKRKTCPWETHHWLCTIGEQQPEVDHAMQSEKSNKGNNLNEFFREARRRLFQLWSCYKIRNLI